ncbi:hypothetical protein [Nonomuraea fastidiosa]
MRSPRAEIALIVPLPKNTLDPRWRACRNHHTACDCREAELAEEIAELRSERDLLIRVLREELAEHATWAYTTGNERDPVAECKCTGCVIARRLDLYSIGGSIGTQWSERGPSR